MSSLTLVDDDDGDDDDYEDDDQRHDDVDLNIRVVPHSC